MFVKRADEFWSKNTCVDADLRALLTSMLSLSVEERPTSVDAILQHAFFTKDPNYDCESKERSPEQPALLLLFQATLIGKLASNKKKNKKSYKKTANGPKKTAKAKRAASKLSPAP